MRKLNFQEMETIQGEKMTPAQIRACIGFGLSAVSMFTGPWGILGLAGMAVTAGDCEGRIAQPTKLTLPTRTVSPTLY